MKRAFKFLVVVIAAFLLISPLTASAITSPAASTVWVEGVYTNAEVIERDGKKGFNLTNTKKDWVLKLTTKSDYKKVNMAFDMVDTNYTISITRADGKAYTATSGQVIALDVEYGTTNFEIVFTDPSDNSVENHTLTVNLSQETVDPNGNAATGAFANIALIGGATIVAVGTIILAGKKTKFHRI